VLAREIVKAHMKATAGAGQGSEPRRRHDRQGAHLPRNIAEAVDQEHVLYRQADDAFKTSVMAMGQMMVDSKMMEKLPDWTGFFDSRWPTS